MQFAHSYVLWLLLLLPLLAWWRLRQRRAALAHPGLAALAPLLARRSWLVQALLVAMQLAALGTLILALARPRWPDEKTRIPTRSTAVMLVLDVSGSMGEKDSVSQVRTLSRLEAAVEALRPLLVDGEVGRGLSEDQIGLLTFATHAEQVCPPTLSHSIVLRLLEEATPIGQPPDASTNIGDALAEAIALLRRAQPAEKAILLISDGEHNVPANVTAGALTPRQAARLAQSLGVRIHTIFVGPESPETQLARTALADVAEMTAGITFRAGDADALRELCLRIAHAERTRIESFRYYRYHEAYPWCGLCCLVFMLGLLTIEGTRWLRVP